jgi:hypothetical protein
MEVTTVKAAAMPAAESESDYWAARRGGAVAAIVGIVVTAVGIADICCLSINVTMRREVNSYHFMIHAATAKRRHKPVAKFHWTRQRSPVLNSEGPGSHVWRITKSAS